MEKLMKTFVSWSEISIIFNNEFLVPLMVNF